MLTGGSACWTGGSQPAAVPQSAAAPKTLRVPAAHTDEADETHVTSRPAIQQGTPRWHPPFPTRGLSSIGGEVYSSRPFTVEAVSPNGSVLSTTPDPSGH